MLIKVGKKHKSAGYAAGNVDSGWASGKVK